MSSIPKSRDEAVAFARSFFDLSDSLVPSQMASAFSRDGSLHFANHPALNSRDAINDAMVGRFSLLDHMKHNIVSSDVVGNTVYTVVSIEYRAKGDSLDNIVTIPAAANLDLVVDDGIVKVKALHVFIDDAPLREKIAALQEETK
ncbi:hypothetical protein QQZ08_009397 [Neonectria magnoliae]|uniref:SnoaL-like domain-containing protein n=1 Tax=Neonectria magnoliae TaxID=2732573 RepID=A0ABR1HNM3_9HYPO